MELRRTTFDRELQRLIEKRRGEKAFFFKEEAYTWEEMDELAVKLAADMLLLGTEPGSRIAIWCQNSPLYICAICAIEKIGGTAVLVNPSYTTWEMNQLVKYADLTGIFCDETTVHKIQSTKNIDFLNYIGSDSMERLLSTQTPSENIRNLIRERSEAIKPEDPAFMLFTSGTTGGAKGVELTHFQVLNVALRAVDAMHWSRKDTICFSLPLFHSFGLSTGLLAAFYHEGNVCLNNSFHSIDIMKCVEKHGCTVLNGVPTMFLSLLYNPERKNYNLSSLDSGIIAGSGVYEQDFLTIAREFPMPHLMQSYGQTEASPSITFSPYDDSVEKKARSAGVVIPDCEVRICDLCTGEPLPPGQTGEVEFRGFNAMKGYFRLNEETEKVLREDGWIRTGDMGFLDEEGYLTIVGRKKEMIIRGGENISPQEIEEVLLKLDGVQQAKVFGIDAVVIQENIAACVVSSHRYRVEEIQNHVRKYLSEYKVPKYVCFYDAFPKNASGKIDINALKERTEKRIQKL